MRKLFDEAGAEVEVPDVTELDALKQASEDAKTVKAELEKLQGSAGIKSLREALARKESLIEKQRAEIEAKGGKAPKEEDESVEVLSTDDIRKTASAAAMETMVGAEVARAVSTLSEEEKKDFKRKFDKLTQGEEVNLETVHVFIAEAERAAFPDKTVRTAAVRSGKSARTEEKAKSYGETDDGKEFAKRMGLILEVPKKKE